MSSTAVVDEAKASGFPLSDSATEFVTDHASARALCGGWGPKVGYQDPFSYGRDSLAQFLDHH